MLYETSRRLERTVEKLARKIGLEGDLFAESVPDTGTHEQEMTILAIRLDVYPRPQTEEEKQLVARMARSVVMTGSVNLNSLKSFSMLDAVNDYIAQELEGEPIPEERYYWYSPQKKSARIERARRESRCV